MLYEYKKTLKHPVHLVLKGNISEDIVAYCANASPEFIVSAPVAGSGIVTV